MNPGPADLFQLVDRLAAALAPLPRHPIGPGERMVRGGHLFAGDDQFVRFVADGVEDFPGLSPVPADELRTRLDRSEGYLVLYQALAELARRAFALHLHERGQAVQDAMEVLRRVRAAAPPPGAPWSAHRLVAAFAPAEEILAARTRRIRRLAQQRRASAAAGPARSPSGPSPQARALAAYRRARGRTLLDALSDALGARAPHPPGDPPGPGPAPDHLPDHLQDPGPPPEPQAPADPAAPRSCLHELDRLLRGPGPDARSGGLAHPGRGGAAPDGGAVSPGRPDDAGASVAGAAGAAGGDHPARGHGPAP